MDQINSNSSFNTARLYQGYQSQQKPTTPTPAEDPSKVADLSTPFQSKSTNSDYATMFDDDALLKLQSNLESIARMAERSLKRIDA